MGVSRSLYGDPPPCYTHHSRVAGCCFLHSLSFAFARGGNYFTRSSCRWANRFPMPSNVGLSSEIKLHTSTTTPDRLVGLGREGAERSVCTFAYRSLSPRCLPPAPPALDTRARTVW
ncbi:hypothetical protein CGRA01v4_02628 [Colletotrichum graminicola]|nr:hypothetical protein CGRA01v4_02628 [Colletotrichum graminicola]